MSKRIDVLTVSVIENSPSKNKQYKLSDGGGLYLPVIQVSAILQLPDKIVRP